jgi:hypothetical protein
VKLLRWLASQIEPPPLLADDPVWNLRTQLRLKFDGTKENADYYLLRDAIEQYLSQGRTVKALTLMQTYGQLMSRETTSFQERHGFRRDVSSAREREASGTLPGGPRVLQL